MVALTSVLLPLYFYPDATTNAWSEVYNNITAAPTVNFSIIINVDSGPGGAALPDSNWITALTTLNSFPNTQLFGYVHTSWTAQDISTVLANMSAYAAWDDYAAGDISVSGIFFDEAPQEYNEGNFTYMSTLSSTARASNQSGIIFNPGAIADVAYYELADNLVMYENSWAAWTDDIVTWTVGEVGEANLAKTSYLVYAFDGTASEQEAFVGKMTGLGLGGLDVTTVDGYTALSGLGGEYVEDVVRA